MLPYPAAISLPSLSLIVFEEIPDSISRKLLSNNSEPSFCFSLVINFSDPFLDLTFIVFCTILLLTLKNSRISVYEVPVLLKSPTTNKSDPINRPRLAKQLRSHLFNWIPSLSKRELISFLVLTSYSRLLSSFSISLYNAFTGLSFFIFLVLNPNIETLVA